MPRHELGRARAGEGKGSRGGPGQPTRTRPVQLKPVPSGHETILGCMHRLPRCTALTRHSVYDVRHGCTVSSEGELGLYGGIAIEEGRAPVPQSSNALTRAARANPGQSGAARGRGRDGSGMRSTVFATQAGPAHLISSYQCYTCTCHLDSELRGLHNGLACGKVTCSPGPDTLPSKKRRLVW